MDLLFLREDFEDLPYREDIAGDYVPGLSYRSRAYPNLVFRYVGFPGSGPARWDAFSAAMMLHA